MHIVFTEHAKRDLRAQRVPFESAIATVLQPDHKAIKQGNVHATRKLTIGKSVFLIRVTHTQDTETQSVLCISKRRLG
ncbi:hypothetical protein HYS54_02355 [Candidatus Micrarchaeota archaeon]|nr:hypothetical protein [Candidatus Micrarchaeota archaeon]